MCSGDDGERKKSEEDRQDSPSGRRAKTGVCLFLFGRFDGGAEPSKPSTAVGASTYSVLLHPDDQHLKTTFIFSLHC